MTDDETTDKNNVGETDGWDTEPRANNTNTVANVDSEDRLSSSPRDSGDDRVLLKNLMATAVLFWHTRTRRGRENDSSPAAHYTTKIQQQKLRKHFFLRSL